MAFATEWLKKRALFPPLFSEDPDINTGIIVVVPAFDEPGIASLLDSLASCDEPRCRVELIIIVNANSTATGESLENNAVCIENILEWKKKNSGCFFRIYYFNAGQPALDDWGVGLARKTGMDEALRRYDIVNDQDGLIVSLDADCTVEKNYFTAIYSDLYKRKDRKACSIRFEHPLAGQEFNEKVYKYVTLYELHMRYFYQAVRYSGYPYAFHTIGSAMAFRASAYLKAGGMSRKEAGEDFYFIQKLIPQGGYFTLNSTIVHPSPRTSGRVPFGTGTVVSKMMDDSAGQLFTYNPEAFSELRDFFSTVERLSDAGVAEIQAFYFTLPAGIRSFISSVEWHDRLTEIDNNTSGKDSFLKRFYAWFNMFRIVKYLNHVHTGMFQKRPVVDAAYDLLSSIGLHAKSRDPYELLLFYRKIEMTD
jgi:hypothetical protein